MTVEDVASCLSSSLRANGSRECAPDDRLREAIQAAAKDDVNCFVAYAPRNDGKTRLRILAAYSARGLPSNSRSLRSEGAGKAGCALHPRSRVPNAQTKTHTSIQVQRRQSGLPCAMVLRLITCSPQRPGFLATVIPEKLASQELDASVGASGPHDFAVRVSRRSSCSASASIASRAALMTLANAPLWPRTREPVPLICPTGPAEYFSHEDWTENSDLPVGQIPGFRVRARAPE
jgi:hypothetical protein